MDHIGGLEKTETAGSAQPVSLAANRCSQIAHLKLQQGTLLSKQEWLRSFSGDQQLIKYRFTPNDARRKRECDVWPARAQE